MYLRHYTPEGCIRVEGFSRVFSGVSWGIRGVSGDKTALVCWSIKGVSRVLQSVLGKVVQKSSRDFQDILVLGVFHQISVELLRLQGRSRSFQLVSGSYQLISTAFQGFTRVPEGFNEVPKDFRSLLWIFKGCRGCLDLREFNKS